MVTLCWLRIWISFLGAHKQSTYRSIFVKCHQFDIGLINPELLEFCFQKNEIGPVFEQPLCSQQLPATFLPPYLQILSVPGPQASRSGVSASFKDDRCSSWHVKSKICSLWWRRGTQNKTQAVLFFFFLFSGGHAGIGAVFLSCPSMRARFPFVSYFFWVKSLWHHLPQGAVLYLVHFPVSGIT